MRHFQISHNEATEFRTAASAASSVTSVPNISSHISSKIPLAAATAVLYCAVVVKPHDAASPQEVEDDEYEGEEGEVGEDDEEDDDDEAPAAAPAAAADDDDDEDDDLSKPFHLTIPFDDGYSDRDRNQ
ncbi:hypothetical protein DPMN_022313 [Dreissena polymorpha]|uniref:Uncharacterized protein n=1 Tax=Dreissena polymorpha TaxID=45954 RepID=A0A9D4SAQ3_DREPO|nr:hypothetical protein DPMN_022313 [Dreissena polymorpha]